MTESREKIIILSMFLLYMALMIAIGFIFNKSSKTNKDYVLGGRQLNPWVTAMSAQASDMSGWLLTGVPALAFIGATTARSSLYLILGLFIGTFINWTLIARKLRIYTEVAKDSLTIPDYLNKRFNDKKGTIGFISGLIILLFFTVYTASMFSAGAKLFDTVFKIEYKVGLAIGMIAIVTYTFLGGFKAVSWTDLIQGIIMFLALIIVPFVVYFRMDAIQQADFGNYFKQVFDFSQQTDLNSVEKLSSLSWCFGYFGMPHILVRFMATKDKRTIKPARFIALIWVIITMFAAIIIGMLGHIIVSSPIDNEKIFMIIIRRTFKPVVAGILLTAVLAAIMSTADSQLLVASSAFSTDIYKQRIRKGASDKEILNVSRITIIIISMIAFGIALDDKSSIFELVEYAWGGFGASFGPVILFSLYSSKIRKSSVIPSMLSGVIVTAVWRYAIPKANKLGFLGIYEILPGFIIASIVLLLVSLIDRRKQDAEIIKEYNQFQFLSALKDTVDHDKMNLKERLFVDHMAYRVFKSICDRMIAVLGLIILFPVLLIVAIAIKIEDGGEIFLKQKRNGFATKEFTIYKFRTMSASDIAFDINRPVIEDNNKALTKIGRIIRKLKIDELPQLINIIKGDMAIIGPRPFLPVYLDKYLSWEFERFNVKPGLTGLAQVSGNGYLQREERSYYDIKYVRDNNLFQDISILIRTVLVVLFGEKKFYKKVEDYEYSLLLQFVKDQKDTLAYITEDLDMAKKIVNSYNAKSNLRLIVKSDKKENISFDNIDLVCISKKNFSYNLYRELKKYKIDMIVYNGNYKNLHLICKRSNVRVVNNVDDTFDLLKVFDGYYQKNANKIIGAYDIR